MYITWSDVAQRYSIVEDYVNNSVDRYNAILYAEGELGVKLSGAFTLPFSSNNVTAKDLTIDIAYAKTQMYRDVDKYKLVMDRINDVTKMLKSGNMGMVLSDGTVIYADKNNSAAKAYSTTQDYPSVFDMGDVLDMGVNSSQLSDEYDAKGYL